MKRVGGYELLTLLGRGGMGAVHRARRLVDGAEVALKLVPVQAASHAARLVREAELARRLDHPGVVRVLDAGVDELVAFVAFELVDGARSLDQVVPELDRRGRVVLVRDVARALGHAHARGVVHRDVKAANVLVDPVGHVRVTDFGVGVAADLDRLTVSGALVGTPTAMAPEQATGRRDDVGPPTDVWALGVLLHEVLTERHPLFGDDEPPSLVAVIQAITREAPRRLRDVDHTIPAALDEVAARALARDPADRFPDAEAMARALDDALAALPRARRGRAPRWTRAAALALLVAALVVAAVAWPAVRRARARALRDDGARLLAAGEVAAAISALRAAEDVEPGSARADLAAARVASGRGALARGDLDAADRALALAGGAPGAAALAAELALARGDLDAAARSAGEGVDDAALAGRIARALVARAVRHDAAPVQAARDLAAALRLDPGVDVSVAAVVVTLAHLAVDDWSDLDEALERAPDEVAALAWRLLAQRADARQRPERCAAAGERSLSRARSVLERAEALAALDRSDEVRELLEPRVDDPALRVGARTVLARLRQEETYRQGMTDELRRRIATVWTGVLALDPSCFEAHLWIGLVLAELGDPRGREHLARACELAPWYSRGQAWQLAGYAALRAGDLLAALAALDEALTHDPDDPEARKQRGIVKHARGDWPGARADLERVVERDPTFDDAHVWSLLVELRARVFDIQGVRAAGERLEALGRGSPELCVFLASALIEAGDLREAEDQLDAVLDGARASSAPAELQASAACFRARVRAELQDREGAVADARRAADLAPDSVAPVAAEALARLAAGEVERGRALAADALARATTADVAAGARVARAWALALSRDDDPAQAEREVTLALDMPGAPVTIGLGVRVLARRAQGDLPGAREDARELLRRLGETCPEAWTARLAREVLEE